MRPEDYAMRRVGFGLIILSAFISALCIWAIWQSVVGVAQ
jgi:hypothetical protein